MVQSVFPVSIASLADPSGGIFNGSFFGNGGGVTNVNVTNLTGVLADKQLPANTAFVDSNQMFSGANIFTNFNNSFRGSFFGPGLSLDSHQRHGDPGSGSTRAIF